MEKIKKFNIIAIIPARGGSRRLPRKNILPLGGVPLMVRVIKTLKKSSIFDQIIVSTEDEEISNIAKKQKIKVHNRPKKLATNSATVVDTCLDVLSNYPSKMFCCVYATAALLSTNTLKESFKKFKNDKNTNVLMGVSKYNFSPEQALKIRNDGSAKMLLPKYKNQNSQKYPKTRVSNGSFYWAKYYNFIREKTFYSKKLKTFDVSDQEICDIDTIEDYKKIISMYKK